ncbi:transglycosylase [Rhizobiales bacterium Sp-1]|uniref:peptidoglycan lytic exotransglycosylase n=2 Tax=Segnochrobactrum spirostomi TaxID=2608987 RepID=A0A6A7Y1D6_9HYPH|nr:transglycosylase [Segnochrobactrum spirostomi]
MALIAGASAFAAEASRPPPGAGPDCAVRLASLPGWRQDEPAFALEAFRRSCAKAVGSVSLLPACIAVARYGYTNRAARAFFARHFAAARIGAPGSGFLTGYYEPEIRGARAAEARFPTPLYRLPPDLVPLGSAVPRPAGFDPALKAAQRLADGTLVPYPDRAAIEAGALRGEGLEIVYVDPIEAFFAQVQGSVRVRLADGTVLRLGYAGKNGHPYVPIARLLIERGEIARADMTADRLRGWLAAHPDAAPALMNANPSYVFFRIVAGAKPAEGPIGTEGVPLTVGRSLAVDPAFTALGTPLWIDGTRPSAIGADRPLRRLVIAQDTGGAIKGAARGDLFVGTGDKAGRIAGRLKNPMTLYRLVPKGSVAECAP